MERFLKNERLLFLGGLEYEGSGDSAGESGMGKLRLSGLEADAKSFEEEGGLLLGSDLGFEIVQVTKTKT